ncbi:helix-turn-helix transcriptional regulator [Hoylesella loescheii]|uniref:helix-turn-helix transcriptional regulator n=1 Tax=Hoylesella loescheii TaxID=840 RepID=UPI00248EB984|nr:helix-turn-helix transcriptional regulator [Hoylesella loescheii]
MEQRLQLPFTLRGFTSADIEIEAGRLLSSTYRIFALFLCTQGSISVNMDSKAYHANKGDSLFIPPVMHPNIGSFSSDLRGIVLYVDYDFIMSIVNKTMDITTGLYFSEHPFLSLSVSQYDRILTQMQTLMAREAHENESYANSPSPQVITELLSSMCRTLTYEILNCYMMSHHLQVGTWNVTDKLAQNFIVEVYNNYRKHRDVAFYADQLCVTPSYLSVVVKEKTGKTALQWINDIVMSDARQLLLYSDQSIKEIVATLGFPNQSFFGKYFKQHTGKSPKRFRFEGRGGTKA